MPYAKIATCCYCGTRAALQLRGETRHELACASCGAPLHEMKMLRSAATKDHPVERNPIPMARSRKSQKKRKPKSLARWLIDEVFDDAFDVIEDIFD